MLRKTGVGFLLSLVFVLFTYSSAVAEWYVGGAVGVAMPHDVDDLSGSRGGYSLGISEFSPDSSFTGGVKVGYFFEKTPYKRLKVSSRHFFPFSFLLINEHDQIQFFLIDSVFLLKSQ